MSRAERSYLLLLFELTEAMVSDAEHVTFLAGGANQRSPAG